MIVIIPPNSFKVLEDGTTIGNITDLSKMPSVVARPTDCQRKAMPITLDRMDVETIYKVWCSCFGGSYPPKIFSSFKDLSESQKIDWNNFVYALREMP